MLLRNRAGLLAGEVKDRAVLAVWCGAGRAAYLEMQKESDISHRSLIQPDPTSPTGRRIAGVPLFTTPACDDDTVWCIPAAHSFVAIRQGATVEADRSAFFSSDQTALRAILRIGFGFTYPEAIVKVTFQRPLLAP